MVLLVLYRSDSSLPRIRQQMYVADPVTGHLPLEQALLNIGNDALLGNVDAVNAFLQANLGFLGFWNESISALI
jgi:hypothetical protein